MNRLSRLVLCTFVAAAPLCAQHGEARYRLTFQATWSAATHPTQFPANPHFSPLVGATHGDGVTFWQSGALASPGIESMAEQGATATLVSEVQSAIALGQAHEALDFGAPGALGTSPAQLSVTFSIRAEQPRLTLVSMLAPSPDWFVGVHDLDLLQGGDWVDQLVVPLSLYDAGTDSGTSYTSANFDTQPPAPIAGVATGGGPFQNAPTVVGSFTLQRLSSTAIYGCGNAAGSLTVDGSAQLGRTLTFGLHDPVAQWAAPPVAGLALGSAPAAGFPCGPALAGFGLVAGQPGEVLLGTLDALALGPVSNGQPVSMAVTVPNQPALVGQSLWLQGLLASTRIGLLRAAVVHIGS